jgi:formylglycine-generating enzyme required for sulfatase activity
MGKYEVTVGQYVTFLEATGEESGVDWNDHDCPLSRSNGRYTLRDGRSWNQPMAEASWYGAAMYCNYLSEKEGLQTVYNLDTWEVDWSANGYRLPTEAEWEYACRAGTQTRFYWGDDPGYTEIKDYCWYDGANSPSGLIEVGQKRPNAFGLYDMSGYVYEWCQDWYGSYSDSNQTDPIGPNSGSNRVLRGGFRGEDARKCRSAHRHNNSPDERHASIGFRLLRSNP